MKSIDITELQSLFPTKELNQDILSYFDQAQKYF